MERRGKTITEQGETQGQVPRMPHEHDESSDSQQRSEPSARRVGGLAHQDAQRGVADTTKAAELEETYDRLRKGDATPPDEDKPRV